jgi:hypothetical protein
MAADQIIKEEVIVNNNPILRLRGEYSRGVSEFSIQDAKTGTGGDIHFLVNKPIDTQIIKLTVTDGYKELTLNPPFDDSNNYELNTHGLKNTILTGIIELEDSLGNRTIVKETINKATYTDTYNQLLESYIDDGIMYLSGYDVVKDKGSIYGVSVIDESGTEIIVNASINDKGYWTSQVDVSSLTEGIISTKILLPKSSRYVFTDYYKTTEVGTLESNLKVEINIEDKDNILTKNSDTNVEENINLNGKINNNGTIEKLILTDGTKEIVLTDINVNEDGTFNIKNINVSVFANTEIRVEIQVIDETGNKAYSYDSIRKQISDDNDIQIEVKNHEVNDTNLVISGIVNEKYYGEKIFAEFEDGTRSSGIINIDGTWEIKEDTNKSALSVNIYTLHSDVTTISLRSDFENQEDTSAEITIDNSNVIDGLATISGTTDAEAGRIVSIKFIDEGGVEVRTTAEIKEGGIWTVQSNVSSLIEGNITAYLFVNDNAGNSVTLEKIIGFNEALQEIEEPEIIIPQEDTSAEITIDNSNVIDGFATISGTTDAEAGRIVSIKFIDEGGVEVRTTAEIEEGGIWTVQSNVSSLIEGNITAYLFVNDNAGNSVTLEKSIGAITQNSEIAYVLDETIDINLLIQSNTVDNTNSTEENTKIDMQDIVDSLDVELSIMADYLDKVDLDISELQGNERVEIEDTQYSYNSSYIKNTLIEENIIVDNI